MRILMIAPQPFLEARGTPISVYQRLIGLVALGHIVDLVTYHLGNDVNIPGVQIHRIPRIPFIKQVKVGPSWSKPFLDLLLLGKAINHLIRQRYDVIHSHEEAAFFACFLAAIFRTRHLYDMHSSLPRQLENFGFDNVRPLVGLFSMLEKSVIQTCDAVITIGMDLEEHVKKIDPLVKQITIENLSIQHSGMTVEQNLVDQLKERLDLVSRLSIVYTGTFERYQGIDLLIEAATIVRDYHPEVLFLLVGGKPQQIRHWQEEVSKRNLGDCIVFLGSIAIDDVLSFMEIADILVLPRIEGTSVPLKLYTYLHSGKPIVATNMLAHRVVLNDDIAVIVDSTKESFAAGIMKLIENPDLRQRLGAQARVFAETHYGFEKYLTKLQQIYRELEFPLHIPSLLRPEETLVEEQEQQLLEREARG